MTELLKAFPMSVVTICRKLLIVGGGHEVDVRLRHAVQFNWHSITVIASPIDPKLREIARDDKRVTFLERAPTEDDVAEADVIFEDSGSRELAEQLTAWSRKHRRRINAMDKPELCDLFYMSQLQRGPITIAIGSGGDTPVVSSLLRKWLEQKVGPGWETASRLLAELRQGLPSGQKRMSLLKSIGRDPSFLDLIERNDEPGMRVLINNALQRMRNTV